MLHLRGRGLLGRGTGLLIGIAIASVLAVTVPAGAQDAPADDPAPADTGPPSERPSLTEPVPSAGRYVEIRGFVDWFERGGIFMYPLLICSVVGVAIIIERFVAIRRATRRSRRESTAILRALRTAGVPEARDVCRRLRGPAARILHAGLQRVDQGSARVERAMESNGGIEVAILQRGLLWLSTVANVAPLLGFLGTVSGMIHAFATIAGADQISARLVAGGIEEALITTETGLSIAIPVQAFYNYFVGRIDRFTTEMEETGLELLSILEPMDPDG
ncbi:MAG: MotA/TolQ/ExbB proton channel family protein [Candidatus Eisenbacteria bacterium]|nr:MotA/TolQ/ExbB proton channel family protein [Candidatus Latescibacterota bacterium]MBD3302162.1 MotA/TolQ/ExbB proton channel family protein [Candidatus Eisenbacteria bacterium]